ncbi:MAG: DUF2304 domain-containing protein [Oscillospiraceae bacterium]|nr:DUF2304 domain-containing protein [Oscillospiraceae bacterium]
MLLGLRILMLVVIVIMFVFFIILLRKQKLELKYCLIWIVALIGIAVLCIFPPLLDKISYLLGIDTPVNTLFLICIAFLACICISLTVVVSSLSDQLRKLTQNIAIYEFEISQQNVKDANEQSLRKED